MTLTFLERNVEADLTQDRDVYDLVFRCASARPSYADDQHFFQDATPIFATLIDQQIEFSFDGTVRIIRPGTSVFDCRMPNHIECGQYMAEYSTPNMDEQYGWRLDVGRKNEKHFSGLLQSGLIFVAITKQAYRFYLKDFVRPEPWPIDSKDLINAKRCALDMLVASDAAESGDFVQAQTLARRALPRTWELFVGLAKHGKRVVSQ